MPRPLAQQQRDLVDAGRRLRQQRRQLRAGIGQVGALLLQVQLAHRAAPGARRQDTHAVFQRGDVLARQPDLALGGAQFEVVARQVAGQRQPGQVQQRGLADYVGVRPSMERRTRPHRSSSQDASKPA